jgi:hypothetical protein
MTTAAAQSAIHGLGTPQRPAPVTAHGSVLVAVAVVGVSAIAALGAVLALARRHRTRP